MLDKLSDGIDDKKSDDGDSEELKFGLPDDVVARAKVFFQLAQRSDEDQADLSDYIFNSERRKQENLDDDVSPHDYKKALFYLYGTFEVTDDGVMAHNLLKKLKFYDTYEDV